MFCRGDDKEGINCERGQQPMRYGMRMRRVAECFYHREESIRHEEWREEERIKEYGDDQVFSGSEKQSVCLFVFLVHIRTFL